jgi:hypothetical protein
LSVFDSESKSNPLAIAEPSQPVKKAITALSTVSLINLVLIGPPVFVDQHKGITNSCPLNEYSHLIVYTVN